MPATIGRSTSWPICCAPCRKRWPFVSLDHSDLTPPAQHDAIEAIEREIALVWQTDEVRHDPVSPLDEVRAGLIVFEQSLWEAVPAYLRSLDRALLAVTGSPLPLGTA